MRYGKGMVTKVIYCHHCGSEDVVKNSFSPNGKQKYLCHECGRHKAAKILLPTATQKSAQGRDLLRAYQEKRSSLRGLRRTFGVSPTTVTSAGSKK